MSEQELRILEAVNCSGNQSEVARMFGFSRQYVSDVMVRNVGRKQYSHSIEKALRVKIYDVDYKDTGCELSPSCLNCPYLVCKEDLV